VEEDDAGLTGRDTSKPKPRGLPARIMTLGLGSSVADMAIALFHDEVVLTGNLRGADQTEWHRKASMIGFRTTAVTTGSDSSSETATTRSCKKHLVIRQLPLR